MIEIIASRDYIYLIYLLHTSNTYYRYIPICGNDSLANPARRGTISRSVPGEARRADVRKDDAAAEDQKDNSQGRPCGRARDDAIRYQSLYRRQFGDLLGR